MSVKLRKPSEIPAENGAATEAPQPIPLQPLQVDGIVVSKESLLRALAPYGRFVGIDAFEDGQRFLLTVAGAADSAADNSRP